MFGRVFEIVRHLNSLVFNPMFECSLNICSDPILVVNVRNQTKVRLGSESVSFVAAASSPASGKLEILKSRNLETWEPGNPEIVN